MHFGLFVFFTFTALFTTLDARIPLKGDIVAPLSYQFQESQERILLPAKKIELQVTFPFVDNSPSLSPPSSAIEPPIEHLLTIKSKSRLGRLINYLHSFTMFTAATQRYLKLGIYFFLLYFFTVVYNVSNKKVLDAIPLPCTISSLVLLVGIPLFLPLWLVKPPRHLFQIDKSSYNIIALCHGLGHLATTYALFSGSVSFTHVVKSAEPLFTALLSYVVTKKQLPLSSYMTLLPIVIGVALASLKEFSFTWFGFTAAMASNFFYQLRMVLSKILMSDKPTNNSNNNNHSVADDKKLSPSNTFRVITIFSFLQITIIALVFESSLLNQYFSPLLENVVERNYFLKHLVISGISFYLYNEIAFWILDLVHPLTSAVGNTIKRVVLVTASILIFRIPVSTVGMIGSAIAILGSFMYALVAEQSKESQSIVMTGQQLTVQKKEEP